MALTVLTLEQIQNLLSTQYSAQAAIPANTDEGSALGAIFNADGVLYLVVQNEIVYVDQIARLGTIPANPDGTPNPDVDSFCAPFNIFRLEADASTGPVVCTLPSAAGTQIVVPVGGVIQTPSAVQFTVVADPSNPNYSAILNGYPITVGQTTTTVTVECNTEGTIGNIAVGQINSIYANMGAFTGSVSNVEAFTDAVNVESDAAYKQRFTLIVSSGRVATMNAILGAVASVQAGVIYSYGDRVNADLTEHDAYFTVVLNEAGTGTGASEPLLSSGAAAVDSVRSGGISNQVIGPSLIHANAAGTISVAPGFSPTAVTAAAEAALQNFINNIGLNVDTTPTKCGYFASAAVILLVPGVADLTGYTLNGVAGDITAPFANQIVAGTITLMAA